MGVDVRIRPPAWLGVAFAVTALGCALSLPTPARPRTSFRLHGTPPDAVVTIDEELIGPLAVVAARGVSLPLGTHQVTVEAPGYFPWDKLVVANGESKRLDVAVDLIPVPR